MRHYFLCSQNKDSIIYGFFQLLAAKQNQKFPFHFLSAPPTPPAENIKKGRKIFGFVSERSEDEARIIQHQDFVGKKFGFYSGDTARKYAIIPL